jgi:hypothetical protein
MGGETMVKMFAAIAGTAAVLSHLDADAQPARTTVADAKPGEVRLIATAAIREPLDAVLRQAEAAIGKRIVVI